MLLDKRTFFIIIWSTQKVLGALTITIAEYLVREIDLPIFYNFHGRS